MRLIENFFSDLFSNAASTMLTWYYCSWHRYESIRRWSPMAWHEALTSIGPNKANIIMGWNRELKLDMTLIKAYDERRVHLIVFTFIINGAYQGQVVPSSGTASVPSSVHSMWMRRNSTLPFRRERRRWFSVIQKGRDVVCVIIFHEIGLG